MEFEYRPGPRRIFINIGWSIAFGAMSWIAPKQNIGMSVFGLFHLSPGQFGIFFLVAHVVSLFIVGALMYQRWFVKQTLRIEEDRIIVPDGILRPHYTEIKFTEIAKFLTKTSESGHTTLLIQGAEGMFNQLEIMESRLPDGYSDLKKIMDFFHLTEKKE